MKREFGGGGGGGKLLTYFLGLNFCFFSIFEGGVPAQKIADKMTFPTKKVANNR